MKKRPSLFAVKGESRPEPQEFTEASTGSPPEPSVAKRPPSREGKRVLSIYLDPLAWKQLRQLALDNETSTQALGEEAVNMLFAKYRLNRSA